MDERSISNICRLSLIPPWMWMCRDSWNLRLDQAIKDRICEIEQNQSPGLGSETRPSSVSNRLQFIIPCDQQLYSHRSSGMHGLLPLRGKPTKNISTRSLSGSQRSDYLRVHAVVYQDYTFKLQPVIWEAAKMTRNSRNGSGFQDRNRNLRGGLWHSWLITRLLTFQRLRVWPQTGVLFRKVCLSVPATLQVAVKPACVCSSF